MCICGMYGMDIIGGMGRCEDGQSSGMYGRCIFVHVTVYVRMCRHVVFI